MKRVTLFALAIAAVASGAIAISQAATTPKYAPTATTRKHIRRRQRVPVAATLVDRFSILRAARTAATTVPLSASDAEHFTEPGTEVATLQLEPSQARSIDIDGTQAWVIPGARGICLLQVDPGELTEGAACSTASEAVSKGIVLVSREASGPAFTVYGLAPDGDSVTIAGEHGTGSEVPARSNFFEYSGGASARSLSIHNANGSIASTTELVR